MTCTSSSSIDLNLINEISNGASTTDFAESVNDRGELTFIDESESDHIWVGQLAPECGNNVVVTEIS